MQYLFEISQLFLFVIDLGYVLDSGDIAGVPTYRKLITNCMSIIVTRHYAYGVRRYDFVKTFCVLFKKQENFGSRFV